MPARLVSLLQLRLIDIARRKGLVRSAKGLLNIVLEIGIERGEGRREAGEILLGDEQQQPVLQCLHQPGAQLRLDQYAFAEMFARAEIDLLNENLRAALKREQALLKLGEKKAKMMLAAGQRWEKQQVAKIRKLVGKKSK